MHNIRHLSGFYLEILTGHTSLCHVELDSGWHGVAGAAGVVALVPGTGRQDGQLTLRPVRVPAHRHGSLCVVVDHLLVLVPEDVLWGLVLLAQGNGAGQDDRTPVVDVELVRGAGVVADNNDALGSVDIQEDFLGESSSGNGNLTFVNSTI